MVLMSETMLASDMANQEVFQIWYDLQDKEEGILEKKARSIFTRCFGNVQNCCAFDTTSKSFFPESWKAVSEFLGVVPPCQCDA